MPHQFPPTHIHNPKEKTFNSPTMSVRYKLHYCSDANEKSIKKWDTRVSLRKFLGHQIINLKNRTNGNPKWAVETGFTWLRLWSNDRLL
jgi:hypothetical protein